MTRYFTIKYAPLFDSSGGKILDVPANSVLETDDVSEKLSKVLFRTRSRDYTGWFYSDYLEPLKFSYPENVVKSETPSSYPYDAGQYIIWKKNIQYNLCGEFCVAYIFGKSIDEFLVNWEAKPASLFSRLFVNGRFLTSGVPDLIDMVKTYNGQHKSIDELKDPHGRYVLLSPKRVGSMLEEWRLIIGCKISGVSGELKTTGIPHWVTVINVILDGFGGWVNVYNPFPNRIETYSWREFISSIGNPYGIFVKP